jgi:amino acid adenylation domain-containing protein
MTGMKHNKIDNIQNIEFINLLKTALTTFAQCEAVTDDTQVFLYRDLDNASDHLTQILYHNLCASGESIPEVFVLVASRSVEYIVAMLACWKLGAGAVPLAQETPLQRARYIIEDLNCRHVIVNPNMAMDIDDVQRHHWHMVTEPVESVHWQRADRDLAYIIYTSGTSGEPKGCAVGLNSLLPMAQSFNQYYGIDATSRMSFAASVAFDAAMMEWLPALLAGASLTIVDETTLLNPALLVRFYQQHKITFSWLPTPVAEILMKDEGVSLPSCLKTLQTAGQRLTIRPPAHWHTQVENAYGPTETTVITTSSPVTAEGKGLPDIGRPLPGVKCYVLDENRQPVADGQTGELYIGGIGVSRGYHHRPDLNREKFVKLVGDNVTQRVYASGDSSNGLTSKSKSMVTGLNWVKLHGKWVRSVVWLRPMLSVSNLPINLVWWGITVFKAVPK